MKYDVAIIGCGPGGMEAARVLVEAGLEVAVIENGQWGGTCLNKGCIPTKMTLAAAAPLEASRSLSRFKEVSGDIRIEFDGLKKRIARYTGAASRNVAAILEGRGARLFCGLAEIAAQRRISVSLSTGEKTEIDFETLVIAVGSAPSFFPEVRPDGRVLLDSDDLLAIDHVPESLCVIGAGAIGLEFASFFSSCGTKITLVEGAPTLAPSEDADIGEELKKILIRRGYGIFAGKKAKKLRNEKDRAILELEDGTRIEAEKALIAVGRAGLGDSLNASAIGCKYDRRGFVVVDDRLMAAENVYAIGDCNGKTLLAHAATHQGAWVARRILGSRLEAYEPGPIPSCVYGSVEIARAGLTAKEAARRGSVEISEAKLASNPIAQAHGQPDGFAKAVWMDGKLAGVAAIGGGVASLATAAELLVAGNYTPEKLYEIMIAHPTLDEALGEAIRQKRTPFKAEQTA